MVTKVVFVLLFSGLCFAQLPPLYSEQEYLKNFVFNEQVVNDKVENTKEFASILDAKIPGLYRPESQKAFPLYSYLVPEKEVVILNTKKNSSFDWLSKRAEGKSSWRFFVHPLSLETFMPYLRSYSQSGEFSATPLSSYRSVLVWQGSESTHAKSRIINLKVSLDAEIGQTRRMLSRSQIERAAVTSLAIQRMNHKELAGRGIHFIDEPFHIYLKKYQYGYSVREIPILEEGAQVLPMFSLYAKKNRKQALLREMMDKSDLPARQFLRQSIIEPLIKHMFYLGYNEGMVAEPHEQNVMVEVKGGRLTGRFFYRDLAGFHFNPELRKAAGKSMDFVPRSFDPENLKTERADIIENLRTYLLESNFYAMRAAANSSSITREWVESTVFQVVREEVYRRTGHVIENWSSAKAAITKYKNGSAVRSCSSVLKVVGL